jgi:hypothetical protein
VVAQLCTLRVLVTCGGVPWRGASVYVFDAEAAKSLAVTPSAATLRRPPAFSDAAYFGIPLGSGLWPEFNALPSPRELHAGRVVAAPRTAEDGVVVMQLPVGADYAVVGGWNNGLLATVRGVELTPDATTEVRLAIPTMRQLTGTVLRHDGTPAADAHVQAFAAADELPLSPVDRTDANGAFLLDVTEDTKACRLRVAGSRGRGTPLALRASDPPALDGDVTTGAVAVGGDPVVVQLPRADVVLLDVSCETPFGHVQVEDLVYDADAGAWGRLGGPSFKGDAVKRAVVPVQRVLGGRPLYVWSWGYACTAVDARGRGRVDVRLTRGREVTCAGRGWKPGDRLRVVQREKLDEGEAWVIWLDGDDVGASGTWTRGDCAISAMEFRLMRDGRVIGKAAVPAGTAQAGTFRIDVE